MHHFSRVTYLCDLRQSGAQGVGSLFETPFRHCFLLPNDPGGRPRVVLGMTLGSWQISSLCGGILAFRLD